ncbi:hypothetical protein [Nocardia sp. NBC_00511]|uniref:hypothetical protein n=1 Tax=Nocardia sp. NBC_00511 TaxID=2903591 RepID=UPI0030E5B8AF
MPSLLIPDSSTPAVTRRTALRLAGGGAVAVAAVGALTACTKDDAPAAPDPLLAQETAALYDSAAAKAAIATVPDRAGQLQTISDQRAAHANTLRTEIDRAVGVYGDGTTPSRRVPPTPPGAIVSPHIAELRTRLSDSQRSAAALSATLTGYRAGLLASISASCATHAGVLLA